MKVKVKISKKEVQKAIKSSNTQEEAAEILNVSRSTLLRLRKEHNLPLAVRG